MNRNSAPKHGELSRGASIRPPVVLLVQVYERKKNIQRIEERIKVLIAVCRWAGSIFRISAPHDSRSTADPNQTPTEQNHQRRPHDGQQRAMAVTDGVLEEIPQQTTRNAVACKPQILLRDKNLHRARVIATLGQNFCQLTIRLRMKFGLKSEPSQPRRGIGRASPREIRGSPTEDSVGEAVYPQFAG